MLGKMNRSAHSLYASQARGFLIVLKDERKAPWMKVKAGEAVASGLQLERISGSALVGTGRCGAKRYIDRVRLREDLFRV